MPVSTRSLLVFVAIGARVVWIPVVVLVLILAATIILLRRRVRNNDLAAAQRSADPYAYMTALARSAWIHGRGVTEMSVVGRLLGMKPAQDRIEIVAGSRGVDREEMWRLIAASHTQATDAYPLPEQIR